jgi:hypothetical protein
MSSATTCASWPLPTEWHSGPAEGHHGPYVARERPRSMHIAIVRPDGTNGLHSSMQNPRCWLLLPGWPVLTHVPRGSEREMKSYRLVQGRHQVRGQLTDQSSDPFNRHRPDLFGLSFRVLTHPGPRCRQEHLERVHPIGLRGHRHHSEHASSKTFGSAVGSIVADDHCRTPLAGFTTARRVQVDDAHLASAHQVRPSSTVTFHSSASPSEAHSSHASS